MDDQVARELLTAQHAEALSLIASMRADLDAAAIARAGSNVDDEHDPEGSTGAFERAQAAGLLTHAENQLGETSAALGRLVDHSYGRCERCNQPIATARLEALPATRYCISCATRQT
jgi:RNA polymerase-binding transcription factor DksA